MPFLSATAIAATKIVMDLRTSQMPLRVWDRLSAATFLLNRRASSDDANNDRLDDGNSIYSGAHSQHLATTSFLTRTKKKHQSTRREQEEFLSALEPMFAWLQIILLWHDPAYSFLAINGLTFMFLISSDWAPRFYSSIMLILFCYNFSKLWFCYIWPEIRVPPAENHDIDRWTYLHPHLLTLPELISYLTAVSNALRRKLDWLVELRRSKPGVFCALVCTKLGVVASIGNCFRGITIVYFVVIGIATGPGIYIYLLPQNIKESIRDYILTILNETQSSFEDTDQRPPMEHGHEDIRKGGVSTNHGDSSEAGTSTLPMDLAYLSKLKDQNYFSSKNQSYPDMEKSTVGASNTDNTLNWIKTGVDVSRSYFDGLSSSRKSSIAKRSSSDEEDMLIAKRFSSSDDEFEIISEAELLIDPEAIRVVAQTTSSQSANPFARSSSSSNNSLDLDLT